MRNPPTKNWVVEQVGTPLTPYATPTASIGLLLQADAFPLAVACMPYAGCARLFDSLSSTDRAERYLSLMVAPAAKHGRAAITQGFFKGAGPSPAASEMWTGAGGSTGADIVTVQPQDQAAFTPDMAMVFGFSVPFQSISLTADTIDDTPIATKDRQLELPTYNFPYVEQAFVSHAAAFSICVTDRVDLESM